jgi:hypothetical protein
MGIAGTMELCLLFIPELTVKFDDVESVEAWRCTVVDSDCLLTEEWEEFMDGA